MSKTRFALNTYTLLELKSQLALKLFFVVSNKSDCQKLSEILLKEGFGSISVTTLYRLFINYNGAVPYKNTLTVLARFIGYDSWENFIDTVESNSYNDGIIMKKRNQENDSLLFHCIENESYKPLWDFFNSIQNKEHSYKVNVALDVYDSLLKTKKPELFFEEFIQNKFVKEYVLEDAFDPAFRIKNYEYAYKLYPNEIKNNDSLESLQDFVFSQSVLFRYYFISKNIPEALQIGKKTYVLTTINSEDLEKIFIFPTIRFKAYKLWFLEITKKTKEEIEEYANELLEYCKIITITHNSDFKKIVFHTVAEVFCYSSLSLNYHLELKNIFKEEFSKIPKNVFEKPLQYALPYFSANGLLLYRPINL